MDRGLGVKCGSEHLPRRCRVSQARVMDVIRHACSDWSTIFQRPCPVFAREGSSCGQLASEVKAFLGKADRFTPNEDERLAFSSIKKLLPPSCECQSRGLLRSVAEKLSSRPRRLPSGYLAFVRKLSNQFFYKGWDKSYEGHCLTTTPPIKSTIESTRRQGGSLGMSPDHDSFLQAVLGQVPYENPRTDGQLIVVQSAGKPRPLSKFSFEACLLKPLHSTIYSRLSEANWLCRGDPTGSKLAKAGFLKGKGTLVSGDYKSATDNLSVEVAEVILQSARANSVFVPDSVWRHALSSLRPHLWSLEEDLSIQVTSGQMMGSFLSFPLLCFQNYLSFRYAWSTFGGSGRLPLMINGDDILFQSSERFARHWMSTVGDLGLEVERTKTSVSAEFGTLNSTLFEWVGDALCVSPTPRLGMLRPVDFSVSLGANFRSFIAGFREEFRFRAAKVFFRRHLRKLREDRLSLDELGFRGSLAWRVARIFGLLPSDLSIWACPALPIPHNVHLPSGGAMERVEEGTLGSDLERLNSYEMASWKWSVEFSAEQSALQYCLQLSSVRRPCESVHLWFRPAIPLTKASRSSLKRRFVRPLFDGPKTVLVFREILASQNFDEYERLPSYEDVQGEDLISQRSSKE